MEGTSSVVVREATLAVLKQEDPVVLRILAESASSREAKQKLLDYLNEIEAAHGAGVSKIGHLERVSALERIAVFREMLSPENESLAGFSTCDVLWRLVQGPFDEEIQQGFVEEIRHLLRAVHGRSGVDNSWLARRSARWRRANSGLDCSGEHIAQIRSGLLDELAAHVNAEIGRYPCGLDADVILRREANRRRILASLGGTDADWLDAQWQFAHVFKGEAGLEAVRELVHLAAEEESAIRLAVRHQIPWGITPYYLSLFDHHSCSRARDGQVRSQVIPPPHTVRAMIEHRSDRGTALDFMLEHETSPVAGVTRRYASTAILKFCDTCPQICTYCQRNWEISDAMATDRLPTMEAIEPALRWFAEHPAIVDVLVTGGDPLVASNEVLSLLLDRLSRMSHVQHIRIGTRVPVTAPMRITGELAELLASYRAPGKRQVSLVTHVQSVYEITPELAEAVDRLRCHGIGVYNQQVFVTETSRRFQTAANRVALRRVGIDPYYTFYPKGKDEHRDYLVPVARLLQERREEARLLPGVMRTDESVFNVPGLGKNYLRAGQDREWIALRPDGRRVYLFHPWEKRVAAVPPWPYVDVSIADYLARLAQMGEDPADYESIWYYG